MKTIDYNFSKLFLIILILIMLTPLSSGYLANYSFEIFRAVLLLAVFAKLIQKNNFNKDIVIIGGVLLLYLILSTIITYNNSQNSFMFSGARFLYIVIDLLLFSITLKRNINSHYYKRLLEVTIIIIITANFLTFNNTFNINSFLSNYYTQYLSYITEYQLLINKPVLIFGVHNIAAFIYEGLFLLSFITFDKTNEKRFILYGLIFLLFIYLTGSTTGYGYLLFNCFVLFYLSNSNIKKILLVGSLVTLGFLFLAYVDFQELVNTIENNLHNGIIPRYINGITGIYSSNFKFYTENYFGMGFLTPLNDIFLADSGYIINLTIGRLFWVIGFIFLLLKFLINNIEKKYVLVIFIYILLMELGFITFYYIKTITFLLLIVLYLNSFQHTEIS